MRFTLFIQSHSGNCAGPGLALRFARAALAGGHTLRQVFFHADGALALRRAEVPSDECDLDREWRAIALAHGTALIACSTAAARRGIGVEGERSSALAAGSLAQLVHGLEDSDRLVSFAD